MNYFDNRQVQQLAASLADTIHRDHLDRKQDLKVYPVPRGGVPAAYAVSGYIALNFVDNPVEADIFIDDIIDSGKTQAKFEAYHRPFYALYDKRLGFVDQKDSWIVWPWEQTEESSIEDNIVRILEYIGEDPGRGGLIETPRRVAKAWKEWGSGYLLQPEDVLKTFEDGAEGVDEMVAQKDIPFYSHCEHHLAPFFGTITIAYVPNKKIVGLSKLARLSYVFSRRLQVQERLTNQIANALWEHLEPKGVGVVIKARHLCIESRGVDKQGQITLTSALRGVIKEKPEARAEFLDFAR